MRLSRVGSIEERFSKRFSVDKETGCWIWCGTLNKKGYGVISGNGIRHLAHRASWIMFRGAIPSGDGAHGTVVMHTCDNPSCVNPNHLRLGTQAENVRDMDIKSRRITVSKKGIENPRSAIRSEEDIALICSTEGNTKALAEQFGVSISTIKHIRQQNGAGSKSPNVFHQARLSDDDIRFIRSTKPGTRGLAAKFGITKEAISNIRRRKTYSHVT